MKKIFFTVMLIVTLTVAGTCAAQDVWSGRWDSEGVDVYIMDETIRDTTPPSAHDYRGFEVSIKLVNNGQVQDILTYLYTEISNKPWEYRLFKRQNGTLPPNDDRYMVPAGNKIFEFSIKHLGWSYTIKNGHYY